MVVAIFLPRREPSANCSLAIALRTGACWATQSIFLCPSGARAGSLISESPGVLDACCMLLLLRSDPRGGAGAGSLVPESPGVLDACCMLLLLRSDPRGRSGADR